MRAVIIHGGQGTGKTRFSHQFRTHYKCQAVRDDWYIGPGAPAVRPGDLVLTNESTEALSRLLVSGVFPKGTLLVCINSAHAALRRAKKGEAHV